MGNCRKVFSLLTDGIRRYGDRPSSMPQDAAATTPSRLMFDAPRVSIVTAITIAVADMIVIGVFTSLGFQVVNIQSGFSVMMLWIVGGIAAMGGALAYAELAAMFPRSGGEYNFLSRIYHPALGFMAGWVSATVGFGAPIALAAMAFGDYFAGVIPGAPPLMLGIAVVWAVAGVHLFGIRQGSAFQNVSTFIKLGLIAALILAGLTVANPQPVSFLPSPRDLGYMSGAPFAIGLVFVLYSYSGWNAATYIAGEIRDPQRNLPYAIITSLLIVLALYVVLNAVFLYSTPMEAMAGKVEVGLIAGRHIFGESGGRIVAALICLGLISSISAMTWIGPRVSMTMGEDIPALRSFSVKNANGVPVAAILFQTVITSLLLLTRKFEAVLEFIQFSLTFCSFLTVLGVIVLRYTHPELHRPYRTWGYPVTPLLFLAVTLFTMYYLLTDRPWQSLGSVAVLVTGIAIYFISHRQSAPAR
jgi:basic amino acid/polyamine antiporter, APA family